MLNDDNGNNSTYKINISITSILETLAAIATIISFLVFVFRVDPRISTILVVAPTTTIIAAQAKYRVFSRTILWPLRWWLWSELTPIKINEWKVTVDIDSEGNVVYTHDFKGKVNFGRNKYMELWMRADEPQLDEQLELEAHIAGKKRKGKNYLPKLCFPTLDSKSSGYISPENLEEETLSTTLFRLGTLIALLYK